jgi:4-amino-4-deoxy-L-arabinose transferase-like glycosyltransferase
VFGTEATSRVVLTPLFLAAVYTVFGPSDAAARAAFALLAALSCLGTYAVGAGLLGSRIGMLAAALAAIFPMFVVISVLPLSENLAIPLTAAVVLLLQRTRETARWQIAALAGLVVGLAILNRLVMVVSIPAGVLFLLLLGPCTLRERFRSATLLILVALATIAPWIAWRSVERGSLNVPGIGALAATVYMGNTSETYDLPYMRLDTGQPGEMLPDEALRAAEAGARGSAFRALALCRAVELVTNPVLGGSLLLRKLVLFWSPYPHPVDVVSWLVVAALACIGVIATWRDRSRLAALYAILCAVMAAHVLTTALPRHRVTIDPLVLVLSAAGVAWLIERSGLRERATVRGGKP